MNSKAAAVVPPSPGQRLLRSAFKDESVDDSMDDLDGTDFDLTPVQVSEFQVQQQQDAGLAARRAAAGRSGHRRRASHDDFRGAQSGNAVQGSSGGGSMSAGNHGRNLRTVFGHDLSDVPEFLSSSQELTWLSQSQEDALKRGRHERTTIHQRVVMKSNDRIREYKRYCRNVIRRGQRFLSFRQWWAAHKTELIRTGGTPQTSPTQAGRGAQDRGSHHHPHLQNQIHDTFDDTEDFADSQSFDLNASSSMETASPQVLGRREDRVAPPPPPAKGNRSRQQQEEQLSEQPSGQRQAHPQLHQRTRSSSSLLQQQHQRQAQPAEMFVPRTRSSSSLRSQLSVATSTVVANDGDKNIKSAAQAVTPPGVKGQKLLRALGPSPQARGHVGVDMPKGGEPTDVSQARSRSGTAESTAAPELAEAAERAARRAQASRRERSRSRSVAPRSAIPSAQQQQPPHQEQDVGQRQHQQLNQSEGTTGRGSPDPQSPIKVIERAKLALKAEEAQFEHLQEEVSEEQQNAKQALQMRLARRRAKSVGGEPAPTKNAPNNIGDHKAPLTESVPKREKDTASLADSSSDEGEGGDGSDDDEDDSDNEDALSPTSLKDQLSALNVGERSLPSQLTQVQGESPTTSRSSTTSPASKHPSHHHHGQGGSSRSPSSDRSSVSAMYGGDSRPPTTHNSPAHSGHHSRTSTTTSPQHLHLVGGDSRPPTATNSPVHSGHNSRSSADLSVHSRNNSNAETITKYATDTSRAGDTEDSAPNTAASTPHNILFSSQPPSSATTPQHAGHFGSGSAPGSRSHSSSAAPSPTHAGPVPSDEEIIAHMHPLPVNVMILAPFDEEQYPGRVFPGYIAAIHNDGQSYDVQYDDGDFRPNVDMSEIVLDDPDYKAHIEQVLVRQRDFRAGTRVMATYGGFDTSTYQARGSQLYPGTIVKEHEGIPTRYDIKYDDGDFESGVLARLVYLESAIRQQMQENGSQSIPTSAEASPRHGVPSPRNSNQHNTTHRREQVPFDVLEMAATAAGIANASNDDSDSQHQQPKRRGRHGRHQSDKAPSVGSLLECMNEEDQIKQQILSQQKMEHEQQKAALVGSNDCPALHALTALGATPPLTALARVVRTCFSHDLISEKQIKHMVKALKKGKHDAVYYLHKWQPKAAAKAPAPVHARRGSSPAPAAVAANPLQIGAKSLAKGNVADAAVIAEVQGRPLNSSNSPAGRQEPVSLHTPMASRRGTVSEQPQKWETYRVDDPVMCRFQGKDKYYPGKIVKVHPGDRFDILYDDGDFEERVMHRMLARPIYSPVNNMAGASSRGNGGAAAHVSTPAKPHQRAQVVQQHSATPNPHSKPAVVAQAQVVSGQELAQSTAQAVQQPNPKPVTTKQRRPSPVMALDPLPNEKGDKKKKKKKKDKKKKKNKQDTKPSAEEASAAPLAASGMKPKLAVDTSASMLAGSAGSIDSMAAQTNAPHGSSHRSPATLVPSPIKKVALIKLGGPRRGPAATLRSPRSPSASSLSSSSAVSSAATSPGVGPGVSPLAGGSSSPIRKQLKPL